jgi:hypothetical protein
MYRFNSHYKPPYESEIEDIFAYNISKYLDQNTELFSQHEVETICGKYRIDFVLKNNSTDFIAIECDGKKYHDKYRDEWRDAMILGSTSIAAIYRIKGSDIFYYINDVIFIFSKINPEFFSKRGLLNLSVISSKQAKKLIVNKDDTMFLLNYLEKDSNAIYELFIESRHKNIPKDKRQFWQTLYAYALKNNGGLLDDIISKYRIENFTNIK